MLKFHVYSDWFFFFFFFFFKEIDSKAIKEEYQVLLLLTWHLSLHNNLITILLDGT
jgi:hypothetical protein